MFFNFVMESLAWGDGFKNENAVLAHRRFERGAYKA